MCWEHTTDNPWNLFGTSLGLIDEDVGMRKKILMVLAWLAVTAGSVVVAAAAVTTAGSAVNDDSVQAVALRDVLTTLVQDAGGPVVTPTPATPLDTPVVTSSPQPSTTTVSTPSTTAVTSTTPVPTSVVPVTTTQPGAASTKTYRSSGGTVVVSVDEGARTVVLLGATSAAGFDVDVEDDGPDEVRVEFKSSSLESKIKVKFEGSVLDVEIDDQSKDGGDD